MTNRIFGLSEWEAWLSQMARSIFGLSAADFEAAYVSGDLGDSGPARDLGSVLPLIRRLRQNAGERQAAECELS